MMTSWKWARFAPCASAALIWAALPCAAQHALSLHAAVGRALALSPEARASAEVVQRQAAGVVTAKLRPNPRLFLQSEDIAPWDKNYSYTESTEEYGYLGQIIEVDGKRRKRIAFAEDGLAQQESLNTLRLRSLTARIAAAYWAAAAAGAARLLWQQQLDDFDAIVRFHAARVASGATAGVDLIRIEIERDRIALQFADAQRMAQQRALELGQVVGLPAGAAVTATDSLNTIHNIPPRPVEPLIADRPDVRAAEQGEQVAADDERLQRSLGVPDPDLLGGYKRNIGNDTLFTALQIPLPLFNRNQGEVARAQSDRRYAADILEQTRLAARSQIEVAVESYNQLGASVTGTLPGLRTRAHQNASIISDAYTSGGADLLRYLDAKRTLIDTELLAVSTLEQYQNAASQLRILYGEQL